MAADLPAPLKAAIDARLEGVSRKDLAERSARMSAAYRSGASSTGVIASPADVTAYLVQRMPATFAAVSAAMESAAIATPAFAPRTLLDVGCGPGTAAWAAAETWPSISAATLVDSNRHFLNAADRLASAAPDALRNAMRTLADVTRTDLPLPKADLVTTTYALAELRETDRADFVQRLWDAATGMLLIVEPGTPDGFERLRASRKALIGAGAEIAAPCPHNAPCPIISPDWCHFSERLARSRDHRLAKTADAPFEDEKYAYIAAARPGLVSREGHNRVLAPPVISKGGMRLKLCTEAGTLISADIPRRDKAATKALRRTWWGDQVPADVIPQTDRP